LPVPAIPQFRWRSRALIVQRNDPHSAQNRLAQPAHAEQQQQNPDGDLQHVKWHATEQRAERDDNERQHRQSANCAECGRPQTAHDRHRKHNGERFDRFDQRSQKRGGDRRSGVQTEHPVFPCE
jgi:hypothetical protein